MLKPYSEYDNSRVGWIDEVPATWDVVPLGSCVVESRRKNINQLERNLLSLSYGRIVQKDIDTNDGLLPESFDTYQIVEPNDVVFRFTDLQNDKRSLRSALVRERGIITSAYLAVTPRKVRAEYFAYAMRDLDGRKVFYAMGGGLRQSLNFADVKRLPILLPSAEEQDAIASYLDRETAEIDAFIADQEELIGLLTERRAATISHAVTKGLDPSVLMKDSGVEWFGEIPASWDVGHLKRFAQRITDGAHISPETDGGVHPFVSTRDIRNGQIDLLNSLRTSPATYDYMVRSGCRPRRGDVLFSKDGTVGRTAVVEAGEPFVVASSLIIISPRALINSRFLNFMLMGLPLQEQISSFVKGAGLPRLSIANLERVIGLLPPAMEQRDIADYLDHETAELDAAIADAREAITLSRERRAALISAAVTGKIDVRGLA